MNTYSLLCVSLFLISTKSWSQNDVLETNKRPNMFLSIDALKTARFVFDQQVYDIDPEFIYQKKRILYISQVGIYRRTGANISQIDYRNKGQYIKLGVGIDLNYTKQFNNLIFIVGSKIVISSYEETGTFMLKSSYFGNPTRMQKNTTIGLDLFFTFRYVFHNNIFFNITPRFSYILNKLHQPHFPVYFAPGFGIINPDFLLFKLPGVPVGLSIRIGYCF